MGYLSDLADKIRAEVPEELLPDDDVASLFRLYAVLALAKGAHVGPEDVHNAWSAWMEGRDPDHPSLRPFAQLDASTQASDQPFVDAIRKVARELK